MAKHGKDPDTWKEDFSMKHLGYTTDNGAYYYYNTEPGKNYEETILELKAYASQAVQFYPHGGQLVFVWLSARTPHGGASYVW